MLQRNLIYTALTRGKQLVVLIGSADALKYAVDNNQIARRFSRLAWRLEEAHGVELAARVLASNDYQ
jgi:exodeoxyribonuclease V alpha subunit